MVNDAGEYGFFSDRRGNISNGSCKFWYRRRFMFGESVSRYGVRLTYNK